MEIEPTPRIPDSNLWILVPFLGFPLPGFRIPLPGFLIPLPGFHIPLLGFQTPLLGLQIPLLGFLIRKLIKGRLSDYLTWGEVEVANVNAINAY